MTEQKQDQKIEEETISQEIDPLSELFEERDRSPLEKNNNNIEKSADASNSDKSKKEQQENSKESSNQKKVIRKDGEEEEEDNQKSPSDIEKTKAELEKTQKRLVENQKYAHKHVQKVKNAIKIAQSLVNEGNLTQEEAQSLIETLQSEEEEGEDHYRGDSHPFSPIFRVANKELENIRKYTEDDTLNDKIAAFDYFLSVSSEAEIKEAFEELTGLIDNPVKLAKRMLAIGQQTYEDSYKDIKESGGVKNLLSLKTQEVEKLQKKIDKLEKKLSQYETYDKPTYRIDEMSEVDSKESESEDPLTPMFKARDTIRRR